MAAASTALGARCRNIAQSDGFCHKGGHVPGCTLATPPKVVLVNFTLNKKLYGEVKAAGIPEIQRFRDDSQSRHELESSQVKREFRSYRQVGDTGSAVFGRNGLRNIGFIGRLMDSLLDLDMVENAHLEPHADPELGGRLVCSYRAEGLPQVAEEKQLSDSATDFLANEISSYGWGEAYVWDNLPRYHAMLDGRHIEFQIHKELEDGSAEVVFLKPRVDEVVAIPIDVRKSAVRYSTSTINVKLPYEGIREEVELKWNDGYWDAVPLES